MLRKAILLSLIATALISVKTEAAEISEDDRDMIATCIEAEAGNQPLYGKKLVAAVILNRVESEEFPDSVEEVISQPGQFSTYRNGAMDKAVTSPEDYEAIKLELAERTDDVMFFNCGAYQPWGKPWKKVGDHYFNVR
jgi:spore germination cell wall hydrolase CwlJ-like protein